MTANETETDDDRLRRQAQQALDERTAALDGATLSRLTQARHHAVEAASDRPRANWLGLRIAGATAAVAAIALTALLMQGEAPPRAQELTLADLELLELDADLELVEEAEFYLWLEEAQEGPDEV